MKMKISPKLHMFDLSADEWREVARAAYPSEEPFWNEPVPYIDKDGLRLTWAHYPSDEHVLEVGEVLIIHTSEGCGAGVGIGLHLIPLLLKHKVLVWDNEPAQALIDLGSSFEHEVSSRYPRP